MDQNQPADRRCLPGDMRESVELEPASVRRADSQRRRGQAVVLPPHQQRGKGRGAVSSSPSSGRRRSGASGLLLAEGGDAAVRHHLHPVHHLHVLFADCGTGGRGVEEMRVESAVGHGAVKAADGPDADREGFPLQQPPAGVSLGRRRGAESF